jgi:hypothetical protein
VRGAVSNDRPYRDSQIKLPTEFFRLPVDCDWQTCSSKVANNRNKISLRDDEHCWADSPSRRRLMPNKDSDRPYSLETLFGVAFG